MHVPTTPLQKLLLAVGSGLVALSNPLRSDMVATLAETTGLPALTCMRRKMLSNPTGRSILYQKPRINEDTLPINYLLSLSPTSFGHQYAQWMIKHNFTSNERPITRFVDDPELAYILQRYREVHDFWHLLSQLDVTETEEIALKIFEFLHTGLPVAALSALLGPFRINLLKKKQLTTLYLPWAIKCHLSTKSFLLNFHYESMLHLDLDHVRMLTGIIKFEHTPQSSPITLYQ